MKSALRWLLVPLLALALAANCAVVYADDAATVASECDISDVSTPLSVSVSAAAIGESLNINAKSAVLMEADTCSILYESNPDEPLPPASITKIMSLLLIMESIDRGDLKLEDKVTASAHAASMGGSQIWLKENEVMTVDELLKAAVIASANDATVALAEKVSGSEEGFVAAMNEKAKLLGMNSTHFENATGLDANGHISTAHDVAVMSRELIGHELTKKYSTVWMESLRDGKTELVNTNRLVRFYEGTTGLKTGTTSGAGYCLSATAERNGLSLVAVIMGGATSTDRFEGAKKLLEYGYANYVSKEVESELPKTELQVKNGSEKTVPLEAAKSVKLLLKKSDASEITQKAEFREDITAPVKKGDKLGTLEFFCKDESIAAVPIIAAKDIKEKTLPFCFLSLLKGLFIL